MEKEKGRLGIVQRAWKEQELIYERDIRMILDSCIKIKPHPLTEGHVGQIWCVAGQTDAIEAIMNHLERRAKLFKGHTKPPKEKEDAKERGEERSEEGSKN